ncbi:MAG: hypothetical protein E7480_02285 [Ruminococcaceae bacterium]|nr:hypothetical protein [Oscillospiraceae bacterium]
MLMEKSWFSRFSTTKQSLIVLGFSFLLAVTFFLPYVIQDGGPFYFYGDYTVQQIPFYVEAHKCVTNGEIFWNWNTDLGANFIGSYTYYMLGSPFFWLVLLLPSWTMPYALPWLLCLKIAVAATTSFVFIRMFVRRNELAFIGALLYAFSGFSIYNIFFNQFHETIALFPLLLIGIEELVRNNRRGIFALAVMINAIANFYFFVAECIFLVVYFIVRLFCGSFKELTISKLIGLAIESVLGVLGAAVFLLPSYLAVIQNPRSSSKIFGWNLLLYYEVQIYPNIIMSMFMPPDIAAKPNFYNDLSSRWSSIAAWMPLFSMSAVIAWMRRRKKNWLGYLCIILIVFAFVPFLNSSFQLFSNAVYMRWFFMLTLVFALTTVVALDRCSFKELKAGLVRTAIITAGIALPVGLVIDPNKKEEAWYEQIGLFKYPERYIISIVIAAVSLWLAYYIYRLVKEKNKHTFTVTITALAVIISIYANVYVASGREHRSSPREGRVFTEQNLKGREKILEFIPDIDNYRSDVLEGNLRIDNQTLFWQIPTIQAFHTMVPGSVMQFYKSVGVTRDVGSRPTKDHVWLRSFLSVKYLFDPQNNEEIDIIGWKKIGQVNNFTVWENENYIPMGFIYDKYATFEQFEDVDKDSRENLLLNAIVLDNEQIKKYASLYTQVNDSEIYYYSDSDMEEAVAERKENTVSNFHRSSKGFSGEITLEEPELVFFTVPYEEGWSAKVNGKEVDIEQVNNGFMAVYCDKGENKIEFSYMTPGLIVGLLISVIGIVLIIAYIIIANLYIKRKKAEIVDYELEQMTFFEE